MPRTHAENRYRFAIKRGHSEERAAWLRDNDPNFCEFHPAVKSEFPGKRRCPVCAEIDRQAVEQRRAEKVLHRTCKKCGKAFETNIIANRRNCHDCHLSAGQRREKLAAKVKVKPTPAPKPRAPKPSLPSTWEVPAKPKPVDAKVEAVTDPENKRASVTLKTIPWSRWAAVEPGDDCPKRAAWVETVEKRRTKNGISRVSEDEGGMRDGTRYGSIIGSDESDVVPASKRHISMGD